MALSSELSFRRLADFVKTMHKKRDARTAQLFFFIQPIRSLVCGVADAVVIS